MRFPHPVQPRRSRDALPPEAALTPERHTHRSRKSLLALLVAVLAIGVVAPSAFASSQSSTSLRGLRPGTSGPAVRHLQKMLAHLGYVVRADGQFGGHTANVVRSFRAATGLPRSARVTPKFLRMLRRAQYGGRGDRRWLGIRRLTLGAKGRDVKVLQKDLTALGYVAATDGELGPQTRASIRSFERAAGLRIDGVMSPKEARTLKRVVRKGSGGRSRLADPGRARRADADRRTGGTSAPAQATGQVVASAPPANGTIGADGLAIAPAGAPAAVVAIIAAGNQIAHKPYLYGGGHDSWQDSGYDCSGSVSFALHGAGLIDHADVVVRLPRLGRRRARASGSRSTAWTRTPTWSSRACASTPRRARAAARAGRPSRRSSAGYVAVHPPGL